MSEEKRDKKVFLRGGFIVFASQEWLEKFRDALKEAQSKGEIQRFVYHTLSAEHLFIVKNNLIAKAIEGDPKPIAEVFKGKVKIFVNNTRSDSKTNNL